MGDLAKKWKIPTIILASGSLILEIVMSTLLKLHGGEERSIDVVRLGC